MKGTDRWLLRNKRGFKRVLRCKYGKMSAYSGVLTVKIKELKEMEVASGLEGCCR